MFIQLPFLTILRSAKPPKKCFKMIKCLFKNFSRILNYIGLAVYIFARINFTAVIR